jgi:hypothetical protein
LRAYINSPTTPCTAAYSASRLSASWLSRAMRKSAACRRSVFIVSVMSRKYQARPLTALPTVIGVVARVSVRPSFSGTASSIRTSVGCS